MNRKFFMIYVHHGYYSKLQYPVNIKTPNAKLAKVIISQLGGPDGELAASLRYLNQRYVMPYGEVKGILTDIGSDKSNTIIFAVPIETLRAIDGKDTSNKLEDVVKLLKK